MKDQFGCNGKDLQEIIKWYGNKTGTENLRSLKFLNELSDDFMTQYALWAKEQVDDK